MTILEALVRHSTSTPKALAFSVEGHGLTFAQLADEASRVAALLERSGLGRGRRCAILLPTSLEWIVSFYALQWLGAVPVALPPDLEPAIAARRLAAVRAAAAVTTSEAAGPLADACHSVGLPVAMADGCSLRAEARSACAIAPAPPQADGIAFLQFTSGTTGEPRAAVILHRQLTASLTATDRLYGFTAQDVLVGSIPLHHVFGLFRFVCAPVFSACPCHLVPASPVSLRRWVETMSEVRATITAASDFAYRAAAQRVDPRGIDLSALRFASNGGEAVRVDTIEMFESRFGIEGVVRPGYGLTETTVTVCSLPPGLPLRTDADGNVTSGPPVSGVEVRIADDEGRPLPAGQAGHLLVKGPAIFAGYLDDPEGTAQVLRDGWLWTGDQASVDADGFVYVLGRERAMIKRGGISIPPRVIEEAVERVPGIGRAAAIGVPDTTSGTERIVVLVEVIDASLDPATARQAVATASAAGAGRTPSEVILLAPGAIPVSASGKVKHLQLREWVQQGRMVGVFNGGEAAN